MKEIQSLTLLYGAENFKDLSESQIEPQNWQQLQLNQMNNTKWLLIVAHPWARLVSIYKSCYEQFNYNCFLKHGKLKNSTANNSTFDQPTFPDFIHYVLQNQVSIFYSWVPNIGVVFVSTFKE